MPKSKKDPGSRIRDLDGSWVGILLKDPVDAGSGVVLNSVFAES